MNRIRDKSWVENAVSKNAIELLEGERSNPQIITVFLVLPLPSSRFPVRM